MRMAATASSCSCVRGAPAAGSAPASIRSAAVLARSSSSTCSARDAISSVLAAKGIGGATGTAADEPDERAGPPAVDGGAPGAGAGPGSGAGDGSADGAGAGGDGNSGSGGKVGGGCVVGGLAVVGGAVVGGAVVGMGVSVSGGPGSVAPLMLPPSPTATDAAITATAARTAAARHRGERRRLMTWRSPSPGEEAGEQGRSEHDDHERQAGEEECAVRPTDALQVEGFRDVCCIPGVQGSGSGGGGGVGVTRPGR